MAINIQNIKQNFVTENRLFSNGIVLPLDEKAVNFTNCYDYAISLIYSDESGFNTPGYTTGEYFTCRQDLPDKVCQDLKNLGKIYRQISIFESRELQTNEYLVKLFYYAPSERFPNGTFHFIRQNRETGLWYHKPGQNQPVIIGDFDPDDFYFTDSITGESSYFYSVCYFAIAD